MIRVQGHYNYLIVGAGLYGAALARELTDRGRRVLVVEKRDHVGGNSHTEMRDGILVHVYGAHIFHTDNERVWKFARRFADFNGYRHQVKAFFRGEYYSLPFNLNSFEAVLGTRNPEEIRAAIRQQAASLGLTGREPANLKEQAVQLVGTDVYEKLIRGYTQKQWGRDCRDLPAEIIRRLPVRWNDNDDYFADRYQGIPTDGYTAMVQRMLEGIDVLTGVDFLAGGSRPELEGAADTVIFTGQIDAYYNYRFGPLAYRGLRFEVERLPGTEHFQKGAVVNYTDADVPWTRIIEHKFFADHADGAVSTIITREYPAPWEKGKEAFYPVRDDESLERYNRYAHLEPEGKVHFGGRLGAYRYYDMDDAIAAALNEADIL